MISDSLTVNFSWSNSILCEALQQQVMAAACVGCFFCLINSLKATSFSYGDFMLMLSCLVYVLPKWLQPNRSFPVTPSLLFIYLWLFLQVNKIKWNRAASVWLRSHSYHVGSDKEARPKLWGSKIDFTGKCPVCSSKAKSDTWRWCQRWWNGALQCGRRFPPQCSSVLDLKSGFHSSVLLLDILWLKAACVFL